MTFDRDKIRKTKSKDLLNTPPGQFLEEGKKAMEKAIKEKKNKMLG